MVEMILKNKKKVGIAAVLLIVTIISLIIYNTSGFKQLEKNNTESIFVEENIDEKNSVNIDDHNMELKDKSIVVEIKGEVKHPDVYTLDEESIVKDVIEKAGGLTENADLTNINRAKKLQNHELIYISNKNDNDNAAKVNTASSAAKEESNIININSAETEELKKLNGIGDSKAKSIIDYREKNGGFKSIEDLKNVDGIGEKMFEKIKDNITT